MAEQPTEAIMIFRQADHMPSPSHPRLEMTRFPRNAVCAVTTSWDDVHEKNNQVSNILGSMNLRGTFYVDPGKTGASTDNQLKALVEQNELGSHTWSHKNLKNSRADEIRQELTSSKRYLEEVTKRKIIGFAYPWGEHSRLSELLVRECGYLFARTVDEGELAFPPANPYAWGISIHAMTKPRLLSKKGLIYVKHLSNKWPTVAKGLLNRARESHGVWHLFGHAWEVLERPRLKDEFLEVCRYVSNQPDIWYAPNGALFLNEFVKSNVQITECHSDRGFLFKVKTKPAAKNITAQSPVPLCYFVPRDRKESYSVAVVTGPTGRYEMGTQGDCGGWINIYDDDASVEIMKS
jgi:hypothetical protein